MTKDFEQILDECIDRLNRGALVEQCLDDYPEQAAELEPLLRAMTQSKETLTFVPSAEAKRTARQRLYDALEKRRQPTFRTRVRVWQPVWITALSIVLLIAITLVTLRMPLTIVDTPETDELPTGIASVVVPVSSASGNFSFMVSDELNAIGDFSSLFVTIDKVVMLKSGATEELVEFTPDIQEFDLTLLPGATTLELWHGVVPEGTYSKVFAYVTRVKGTLRGSGDVIDVKLPSDKLQLTHTFEVKAEYQTNFTFDITVVNAGKAEIAKYILKPQASESGTTQTPAPKTKGKP